MISQSCANTQTAFNTRHQRIQQASDTCSCEIICWLTNLTQLSDFIPERMTGKIRSRRAARLNASGMPGTQERESCFSIRKRPTGSVSQGSVWSNPNGPESYRLSETKTVNTKRPAKAGSASRPHLKRLKLLFSNENGFTKESRFYERRSGYGYPEGTIQRG